MSYTLSSNLNSQPLSFFNSEGEQTPENSLDTNISPGNSLGTVSPSHFLSSHFDDQTDGYDFLSMMDQSDDLLSSDLFSTDTSPSYGLIEDVGLSCLFNDLETSSLDIRRDELRASERSRKESLSNLSNNVPSQVMEPQFQLVPMDLNKEVNSSSANPVTNKENSRRVGDPRVIDIITIYSSDEESKAATAEVERMKKQIEETKKKLKKRKKKTAPRKTTGWQRANNRSLNKTNGESSAKNTAGWQHANNRSLNKTNGESSAKNTAGWQCANNRSLNKTNGESSAKNTAGWQRANNLSLNKTNGESSAKNTGGWQRSPSSSAGSHKGKKSPAGKSVSSNGKRISGSVWQRAKSYDGGKNSKEVKSKYANSPTNSGWQRPVSGSWSYPDHERIPMSTAANVPETKAVKRKCSPTIFDIRSSSSLDSSLVKEETVIQDSLVQPSDLGSEVIIDAPPSDLFGPHFEPKIEQTGDIFHSTIDQYEVRESNDKIPESLQVSDGVKLETVQPYDHSNFSIGESFFRPRSSSGVRESLPAVNQTIANPGMNAPSGLGRHKKKIKGLDDEIRDTIASGRAFNLLEDLDCLNDSILSDISSNLNMSAKLDPMEESFKSVEPLLENSKSVEPLLENSKSVEPLLENSKSVEPLLENNKSVEPLLENSKSAELLEENSKTSTVVEDKPSEYVTPAVNSPFDDKCFTDPIAARTRRGISHSSKQQAAKSEQSKAFNTNTTNKGNKVKPEPVGNCSTKSVGSKKKKTCKKTKGKCIKTIEESFKNSDPLTEMPDNLIKTESNDLTSSVTGIIRDVNLGMRDEKMPSKSPERTTDAIQKQDAFDSFEAGILEDFPDDFLFRGLNDYINHPSVDSAMRNLINEIEIDSPDLFRETTDNSKQSFLSMFGDPFGSIEPKESLSSSQKLPARLEDCLGTGDVSMIEVDTIIPSVPSVLPFNEKDLLSNHIKKEELNDSIESPVDHNYAISPKKVEASSAVTIKPGSPVVRLNFEETIVPSTIKSEEPETEENIINKLPGYLSDPIKSNNSSTKRKIDINQYKKRKSLLDDDIKAIISVTPEAVSSAPAYPDIKYSSLDSMLSSTKTSDSTSKSSSPKKVKHKTKSKKSSHKKKKSEAPTSTKSLDSSPLTSKQAMYDELNRDCEGIKNKDVSNQIKKMILQAKLKDERDEITQKLEMKVKACAARSENGGSLCNSFGSEIIKNMTLSSVERSNSSRSSSTHPTSRSSSRQCFSNDCDRLYSSDEKHSSRSKRKSKKKHRKRSRSPRRRGEKRYYDSDESEYERSRSRKKRKRRSYSRSSSTSSRSSSSSSSHSSRSKHRKSKRSRRRRSGTSSSSSRPYSRTSSHYQEAPYSPPFSSSCHSGDPHSQVTNCKHYTYNYPQYSSHYNYGQSAQYLSDYPRSCQYRSQRHHLEQDGVDRNVLHIGNITQGTTRDYIRERFSKFGRIIEVRMPVFVYDDKNFGFVKFSSYAECARAIDHGNDNEPIKFQLCFGNRREFCKQKYKDLDALPDDQVYVVKAGAPTYYTEPDSYDAMLSEFKMMKNNSNR